MNPLLRIIFGASRSGRNNIAITKFILLHKMSNREHVFKNQTFTFSYTETFFKERPTLADCVWCGINNVLLINSYLIMNYS